MRRKRGVSLYAAAVAEVLAPEFPRLDDADTNAAIRAAIIHHAERPHPAFEYIIDAPVLANWRLRADPSHPGRVRLACYRPHPTEADLQRESRVNQQLAQIHRWRP